MLSLSYSIFLQETSIASDFDHLALVPLAEKLGLHQQNTWLVNEGIASLSKAVLVSPSRDASTLSSVVGSYGDHTFSSGANWFPHNTAPGSEPCMPSNNLFATLFHLMEPLHVRLCVSVCLPVFACVCARVCLVFAIKLYFVFYEGLTSLYRL